jgi:hypothetical protein
MATFGELIHGRKPDVAPFIPTDPMAELQKLLSGEITDFPQITQLSDLYQKYMMGALDQAIPGFTDSMKTGGADTQALLGRAGQFLTGNLPPDVMAKTFRDSAFQNLGSGLMGSPAGGANAARNLGLTSLDVMKQGAGFLDAGTNAAQRWAQIASGTILPPSQQLYSPEWFTNFMAQQNQAKQNTQQFRYNVAAQPDPAWADRAKLFASITGSFAGAQGAGNSMNTYSQLYGGGGAGGSGPTNWGSNMGQGTGAGGGYPGVGPQGQANFGTNFSNAWSSPDPNYQTQGVGGALGGYLGGIFNQG